MKFAHKVHRIEIKVLALVFALLIMSALLFFMCGCAAGGGTETPPGTPPALTVEEGGSDLPDPSMPSREPAVPNEPAVPSEPAVTEPQNPKPPEQDTKPPEEVRDMLLKVTASALNVRAGAGTSYKVIGSFERGDRLVPSGLYGDWYRILYRGDYGYVSAKYVEQDFTDRAGDAVERVIDEGKKLLGTPYVYGAQRYHFGGKLNGAFKPSEFDCSSLMQYIFKIGAGINLAATSREQSLEGKETARENIRRGDLLFFTNDSRKNNSGLERIGHVGLYLGDNLILHTASDYAVIEDISTKRWSYYITARRPYSFAE